MASARSIRDFTRSARMSQLSANAERLFVRLLLRADDYGNIPYDIQLLKAECFPLLSAFRFADMVAALEELLNSAPPMLCTYTADLKVYIHIYEFGQAEAMRWPKNRWPLHPEQVPKEKKNQKKKEVETEVEDEEREKATTLPISDANLRGACMRFMLTNCEKYFPELKAQWLKAEASIVQNSKEQSEYDEKIAAWRLKFLQPAFATEFEKFFNYYSAKGWEHNEQKIVHKFSQFKVWLTRKK